MVKPKGRGSTAKSRSRSAAFTLIGGGTVKLRYPILSAIVFGTVVVLIAGMLAYAGQTKPGRLHVVDANTIEFEKQLYRFANHTSPDKNGAGCAFQIALAERAANRVEELIEQTSASDFVKLDARDTYGNDMAAVYVRGQDISTILIKEGLAQPTTRGRLANWC